MSDIRIRLLQLETRLQALVEGSVARLFPGRYTPHELALLLEEAMRTEARSGPNGTVIAPNLYVLGVNEEYAHTLQEEPAILEELARLLQEVALDSGLRFHRSPVVRLEAVPGLAFGDLKISAHHSLADLPNTVAIDANKQDNLAGIPSNAFLIVDGTQVVALDASVVNIGRRHDNQLVIDDPRVSRLHAQLRVIKGNYVIFDLDSIGGTYVNGERIQQCRLHPGDVITLSGVPLVFGQDAPSRGITQEYRPGE